MKADELDARARQEQKRRVVIAELRDLGAAPSELDGRSLLELLDMRSRITQTELMGAPRP